MSLLIESGLSAQVALTVREGDLAIALGSGDVPMLATPRVIALCEEATVAALAGALGDDETTVGTRVECDHLAPSHVGEVVTASATLVEVDGRRLVFHVTVVDGGGRRVAQAQVHRAMVERRRFLER